MDDCRFCFLLVHYLLLERAWVNSAGRRGLKAEGNHRCSSGRVGGARHVVGRPCLNRAEAVSRGEAHAEEQAGARAEHRSQCPSTRSTKLLGLFHLEREEFHLLLCAVVAPSEEGVVRVLPRWRR